MFLMKEHVGKLITDLKNLIYRDIRPKLINIKKREVKSWIRRR